MPASFTCRNKIITGICLAALLPFSNQVNAQPIGQAQSTESQACKLRPFIIVRAEERYDYLAESDCSNSPWAQIKHFNLSDAQTPYLTFGGEVRIGAEFYENRVWESSDDNDFWTHRVALHAALQLGPKVRVFGELYHGYTSGQKEFASYDELALHQAFVEYRAGDADLASTFRAGRQEFAVGSGRLIGLREGPNIRRSFDGARLKLNAPGTTTDFFIGREVRPAFGPLNNSSNLFDDDANNPLLWGAYAQFQESVFPGAAELYYFGFDTNMSRFNDVSGPETRHTFGLRLFDTVNSRFSYNTEIMYQFGDIGNSDIRAFNLETDWTYLLYEQGLAPELGLKLEWSSGDDQQDDGVINTYNPMFVNPAYYSLAKTITPVNLASIHPSISFSVTDDVRLEFEWAKFWRASENDGFYAVPRFLTRPGTLSDAREIGAQIGVKLSYDINQFWSAEFDASYFFAGQFIKDSGSSEDAFHFAPSLRFRF